MYLLRFVLTSLYLVLVFFSVSAFAQEKQTIRWLTWEQSPNFLQVCLQGTDPEASLGVRHTQCNVPQLLPPWYGIFDSGVNWKRGHAADKCLMSLEQEDTFPAALSHDRLEHVLPNLDTSKEYIMLLAVPVYLA